MPDVPHTILLAEDNDDDVFFMKRALKTARIINPLFIVRDGEEAIDYLDGKGPYSNRAKYPYPNLIFLDLKMPRKSGFEVLQWMRDSANHVPPVCVLSSSDLPQDVELATKLGAKMYLVKPPAPSVFDGLTVSLGVLWVKDPAA